jgi:hypothetical protein
MRQMAGLLLLLGCTRQVSSAPVDAGAVERAAIADAGVGLSLAALDAWLSWQATLAKESVGRDAGTGLEATRRRARREARALEEVGLSFDEVDRIEALVAAAVAEWSEQRLGGDGLRLRVSRGLAELSVEQRERAEAALFDAPAVAAVPSSLEARFGVETTRSLLARRAELTRAWDALVDARTAGR